MLPYRDSRLTRIALVVFFLIVAAYAYFEARGILFGPNIHVNSQIQEVHDQYIVIRGTADRIAELKMNGKSIPVTETGAFEEPYLLSPGLNRIVLDATDKYGRARQKVIQIVYTPRPGEEPTVSATTTPAATTSSSTTAAPKPPTHQ